MKYRIVEEYDVARNTTYYSIEKQDFWIWKWFPLWTFVPGSLDINKSTVEQTFQRLIETKATKNILKEVEI